MVKFKCAGTTRIANEKKIYKTPAKRTLHFAPHSPLRSNYKNDPRLAQRVHRIFKQTEVDCSPTHCCQSPHGILETDRWCTSSLNLEASFRTDFDNCTECTRGSRNGNDYKVRLLSEMVEAWLFQCRIPIDILMGIWVTREDIFH